MDRWKLRVILTFLFSLNSLLDPFVLTRKSLASSDIMTLHVSRPNIREIYIKKLLSNSRYYSGVLTGADIQNIRCAGWDSYALGWKLLGSPLQNSSLLTGLNWEAQPSLKMLVFGMNLAGKFKCNVFPGRLNYQPPLRKIRVHSSSEGISREEWTRGRASSPSSVPTCAASYSTAVIWPLCDK